jgi:hypothetical protein
MLFKSDSPVLEHPVYLFSFMVLVLFSLNSYSRLIPYKTDLKIFSISDFYREKLQIKIELNITTCDCIYFFFYDFFFFIYPF